MRTSWRGWRSAVWDWKDRWFICQRLRTSFFFAHPGKPSVAEALTENAHQKNVTFTHRMRMLRFQVKTSWNLKVQGFDLQQSIIYLCKPIFEIKLIFLKEEFCSLLIARMHEGYLQCAFLSVIFVSNQNIRNEFPLLELYCYMIVLEKTKYFCKLQRAETNLNIQDI